MVKKGAQIWTVMRRYSEFRSCFTKLRQSGILQRTEFPPKTMGKLKDKDLRKRQRGLIQFLIDALSATALREWEEGGDISFYDRSSSSRESSSSTASVNRFDSNGSAGGSPRANDGTASTPWPKPPSPPGQALPPPCSPLGPIAIYQLSRTPEVMLFSR